MLALSLISLRFVTDLTGSQKWLLAERVSAAFAL
jgi:hypothetical protein